MARRELGTVRFQDPSRWLVEISLTLLLPNTQSIFFYVVRDIYVHFIFLRSRVSRPMAMTAHVGATWGGSFWRV